MNSELTDYIDSIEEDTDDINRAVDHIYGQLKNAHGLACALRDALKCEEDRVNDLENEVEYYKSFIETQQELFTAWQVANRMES